MGSVSMRHDTFILYFCFSNELYRPAVSAKIIPHHQSRAFTLFSCSALSLQGARQTMSESFRPAKLRACIHCRRVQYEKDFTSTGCANCGTRICTPNFVGSVLSSPFPAISRPATIL